MPDVVMISNYWHFPWEKSSSRYHTAAAELAGAGMTVEVVTSSFYHTRKRQHEPVSEPLPYRATLLHERGYAKNVSPTRVFSHRAFARRVVDYLKKRERPDAIYLFVPPTGLAKRVVQFAKRNGIPVVIDVLDLWPEAFDMVLPHAVAQVALRPMKRAVEYAYANADAIVAVSQTYVQRALRCNDRCAGGRCVFIGTELAGFDRAAAGAPELTGRLRPVTMAYIGMLGHSYDLCGVMDAMALLREQGFDETELLVMGDGPLREKFERYAAEKDLPVRFTGRLPYTQMVKKLVRCDIGLNVLVGNAAQSIINKHADYLAAGLPVINVQKLPEFGELLEAYHAGMSCAPGDTEALAACIRALASDAALRRELGKNSRRLGEEQFDRAKTYGALVEAVREVAK